MNRSAVGRFLLFVALAGGLTAGWYYVERTFFPKPPKPVDPPAATKKIETPPTKTEPPKPPEPPKVEPPTPPKIEPPKPSEPQILYALGDDTFYKRVLLTNKGAAIQQVILPNFPEGTRAGKDSLDENKQNRPLYLIPGFRRDRNPESVLIEPKFASPPLGPGDLNATRKGIVDDVTLTEPSFALMHYPAPGDPTRLPDNETPDNFCSPELMQRTWKLVDQSPSIDGSEARAVFETELAAPYFLRLRKTFTLKPKEYHVGMRLDFEALPGRPDEKVKERALFRYQIVGGRGLPIEGEWYTSTFRNALTCWTTPSGNPKLDIQDSRNVGVGAGGSEVQTKGNETFVYAGIGTSYFASVLAIDDSQPEEVRRKMWDRVRPTRDSREDLPSELEPLRDMTMRAVANTIDPQPGKPVSHSYLIYNGPLKVRLLKQETGNKAVEETLVDRYHDKLYLGTLTDHHSPHFFGRLSNSLYIADLLIWITNRMHGVLGLLHKFVPNWGIDIILLTLLVRLLLIVPSRRQQANMAKFQAKMAALTPEIEKLKEKYGQDFQKLNQEKSKLMMQNGVNPLSSLGGCLFVFVQMPVFIALMACLGESFFFRLQGFLWIPNLAAPDMLLCWGENIPGISKLANLGEFYYLGPFLNILPIASAGLMFIHQKLTMPPPADEQQEMQQRMMKIMMFMMVVIFFKFAAGLSIYFIISTLWGLAEKKLMKKPTVEEVAPPTSSTAAALNVGKTPAAPSNGFFGRMRARIEELQSQADTQRQIRNDVKPGQGPNPSNPGPTPGNSKKKKKKK